MCSSTKVEDFLESMRFATVPISTLPGFQHHTLAVVDESYAYPEMDLTATPTPLLGMTSGRTKQAAIYEAAETALNLRHRQLVPRSFRLSFGFDEQSAIDRAVAGAWERVAEGILGDSKQVHRVEIPESQTRTRLQQIAGELVVTELDTLLPLPLVMAELHLARAPYYLASVGCGDDATERAIMSLHCKFDAFRLARSQDTSWTQLAKAPYVEEGTQRPGPPRESTTSVRSWHRDGIYIAEANVRVDTLLCDDSVLERVDSTNLELRGPVEFSMAYAPENVLISRTFHENSKLRTRYTSFPLFDADRTAPAVRSALTRATRDYRFTKLEVPLSEAIDQPTRPVEMIQKRRRSWARITDASLSLEGLSHVLRVSYGVTGSGVIGGDPQRVPLRATPSGGGLYSNDIYVLASRVEGLSPGLYYFNPDRLVLQLVNEKASVEDVANQTGYQERVKSAPVVLLLAGSFRRNQWKYWERGYRTVLLDCGHLAQSLVITSGSLGLVAHPIGGFVDDSLNDLVGLDGVDDAILHLILIGHGENG